MDLSDIIWSLITAAIVFGPSIISAILKKSGEDAPKRPTSFPMEEMFPQFDEELDEEDAEHDAVERDGAEVGDGTVWGVPMDGGVPAEPQVRIEAVEKPAVAPVAAVPVGRPEGQSAFAGRAAVDARPVSPAVARPEPLAVSRVGVQSVAPAGLKQKLGTVLAEEQGGTKMEIDAKKLIIYSSIMNPKFREN